MDSQMWKDLEAGMLNPIQDCLNWEKYRWHREGYASPEAYKKAMEEEARIWNAKSSLRQRLELFYQKYLEQPLSGVLFIICCIVISPFIIISSTIYLLKNKR
jgi:hypothetical protein